MPVEEFRDFVIEMIEGINEETIRAEYDSILPWMYAGILKFKAYSEYKDARIGTGMDNRPVEEILQDTKEIRKNFEGL